MTDIGPAVYVDSQSYMPEPMRMEYRRVLVEELRAIGVEDAIIRSRYADDYESLA